MNEESEAVEEDSSNATLESHDQIQSCSIETQQVSVGAVSCSSDGDFMRHIEEGQRNAVSVMYTNLDIPANDLLTEDVTTHCEFMKVLADVVVSVNEYFELLMQWKGHQSFVKKNSSICTKYFNVEKAMQSLKTGLTELTRMRVVATNLTLQLQSCQAKLSKMTLLLPAFFDAKRTIEDIIPNLQGCIRAQKQRKFNKLTGGQQFVFLSNNSIGLTWDVAIDNLNEIELSDSATLFLLNAGQLKLFPAIKDRCHKDGMVCILD